MSKGISPLNLRVAWQESLQRYGNLVRFSFTGSVFTTDRHLEFVWRRTQSPPPNHGRLTSLMEESLLFQRSNRASSTTGIHETMPVSPVPWSLWVYGHRYVRSKGHRYERSVRMLRSGLLAVLLRTRSVLK